MKNQNDEYLNMYTASDIFLFGINASYYKKYDNENKIVYVIFKDYNLTIQFKKHARSKSIIEELNKIPRDLIFECENTMNEFITDFNDFRNFNHILIVLSVITEKNRKKYKVDDLLLNYDYLCYTDSHNINYKEAYRWLDIYSKIFNPNQDDSLDEQFYKYICGKYAKRYLDSKKYLKEEIFILQGIGAQTENAISSIKLFFKEIYPDVDEYIVVRLPKCYKIIINKKWKYPIYVNFEYIKIHDFYQRIKCFRKDNFDSWIPFKGISQNDYNMLY